MRRSAKRSACILFSFLCLAAPGLAAATSRAAEEPAAGPVLARELARLDERLDLATFPDGTGDWLSRVAASLEYRVGREAEVPPAAPHLMRRLAAALRALGVEHDLEPPPGAAAEPSGEERSARLDAALAAVRALHAKLDPPGDDGLAPLPAALPANDSCAAATTIVQGTVAGTTVGADSDGTASCGSSSGSPDVWYRYTAPADGPVSFDTFGSTYDTVLSVLDGCPDGGRETEHACNDDAGGSVQSEVSLEMTAGQEVWVRVSGFGGGAGSFSLSVEPPRGIAGTVTRAADGTPLAGVEVRIYRYYSSLVASGTTAADGTYRVSGLEDGTYYAQTQDSGLIDEIWEDLPCPSWSYCWPSDGTPIEVNGGITTGIDFALSPAGTIAGVVTDAADSQPLDAYVSLYSATGSHLDSVYSGNDGTFEFSGLPVGKYRLRASASDYQAEIYDDVPCPSSCSVTSGTQVAVLTETTTQADFALDRLGSITGRVTEDPSGLPIAGERVVAQPVYQTAYTRSDGSYELAGLPPGSYSVRTETDTHGDEVYDDVPCTPACPAGTPVAVSLSGETSGIDFSLRRLGAIAGRVVHRVTGLPLVNVRVRAVTSNGYLANNDWTDSSGNYRIENLPAGTYHVITDSSEYAHRLYDDIPCWSGCTYSTGTAVAASLGTTTTGIDFRLDSLGTIAGKVTAADTGSLLSREMALYDDEGDQVAYAYSSGSSGYLFSGLLPGMYRVATADYYSYGYQDELYPEVPCEPSCDLALGSPVPVDLNGSVLGVDFVLQPCPGESYVTLLATRFLSTHELEACERLSASGTTLVEPGADVTFRAGGAVTLGNGFAVRLGGRLRVQLEPAWAQP